MGGMRKVWFSGRALAVVAVCAALVGAGAWFAVRADLALDGSGRDLAEVRALGAELAPGTAVVFYGPSPLERLLVPAVRGSDRVALSRVDPRQVVPQVGIAAPVAGDVLVRSGPHWLLLARPDMDTLLWALSLVSSPYAPTPVAAPPAVGSSVPGGSAAPSPEQAGAWMATGLALPAVIASAGLWWRRRRRGQ